MRHLHFEFVCASFSLGLAVLLFGAGWWQLLWLVNGAHGAILPIWLTTLMSFVVFAVLIAHAYDGIRAELRQPKRRRYGRA